MTSTAQLARLWSISGPLAENCEEAWLDCSAAAASAGAPQRVYLDPTRPFSVPPVTCPNASSSTAAASPPLLMRAFVGARCQLWREDNTAGCYWDARLQAFAGGGCEHAPSLQCACTHLTDFQSGRKPVLQVASLSQMSKLTAADLVTKLRAFFAVVLGLFGGMLLSGAALYALDEREKKRIVGTLKHRRFGYANRDGGAWLWSFPQAPVRDAVGHLTGSAVEFMAMVGIPFVRFRCAVPEELYYGELSHAVGRHIGISAEEIRATLPVIDHKQTVVYKGRSAAGAAAEQAAAAAGQYRPSELPRAPSGAAALSSALLSGRSKSGAVSRRHLAAGGSSDVKSPVASAPSSGGLSPLEIHRAKSGRRAIGGGAGGGASAGGGAAAALPKHLGWGGDVADTPQRPAGAGAGGLLGPRAHSAHAGGFSAAVRRVQSGPRAVGGTGGRETPTVASIAALALVTSPSRAKSGARVASSRGAGGFGGGAEPSPAASSPAASALAARKWKSGGHALAGAMKLAQQQRGAIAAASAADDDDNDAAATAAGGGVARKPGSTSLANLLLAARAASTNNNGGGDAAGGAAITAPKAAADRGITPMAAGASTRVRDTSATGRTKSGRHRPAELAIGGGSVEIPHTVSRSNGVLPATGGGGGAPVLAAPRSARPLLLAPSSPALLLPPPPSPDEGGLAGSAAAVKAIRAFRHAGTQRALLDFLNTGVAPTSPSSPLAGGSPLTPDSADFETGSAFSRYINDGVGVNCEQLTCTAFVFAFLYSTNLVDAAVLAKHHFHAARFFASQPGPRPRHDFEDLLDCFLTMLGPENMRVRKSNNVPPCPLCVCGYPRISTAVDRLH